jgi:hypothetical protein
MQATTFTLETPDGRSARVANALCGEGYAVYECSHV